MQFSMDEHGNIVKEPATSDDLTLWATALQAKYFPGFDASEMQVAVDVEPHPRGPSVYFPEKNLIAISERITPFHELAKIALLHEMIHVKLYAENKDADEAHGERFQAEMQRLIAEGAYNNLL